MDEQLLDLVLERLHRDDLPATATDLVIAACESTGRLEEALGGGSVAAPERAVDSRPQPEPVGAAYLRSLHVQGFRGIGDPATLPLTPGPGLTVITGRNGSGKSSFAEAFELLLTGKVRRWEGLSAVWREGWRNRHTSEPTEITAELDLDGTGPTVVGRTWGAHDRLDGGRGTMQVAGSKRADIDALGWTADLATYRPFLAHSELEAFFGAPGELYRMLASVLGLDDLSGATERLRQARLTRDGAMKEARRKLDPLLDSLAGHDDPRAARCHAALSAAPWDLDTVESLVAPAARPPGSVPALDGLRALAQLEPPAVADAEALADRLDTAADELSAVQQTDAGRAATLADLLRAALAHHADHGDGPCPVCRREGALDRAWRAATEAQLVQLDQEAREATDAARRAKDARDHIPDLVRPMPASLLVADPLPNVDLSAARTAWKAWTSLPEGAGGDDPGHLHDLARHLRTTATDLATTVADLAKAASDQLATMDEAWSPLAAQLADWCKEARAARASQAVVPTIKTAESWFKRVTDEVRNARLRPLADRAKGIWAELRQESNVDLGALRLTGSGPQQKAVIDVTVDGEPSAALGVMSQGEVNALALSVFLPRATLPASPFRFLVIDDPVQAMDPAKVDGLARVLERVAQDRQVVVFTHDERLPEAIRRLEIKATVLQVTRRSESKVEVRPVADPARRALDDAFAVCRDDSLPHAIAARVVGPLCRTAVEIVFTEAARRRLLSSGGRHADVEEELSQANSLNKRAALALCGDPGKVQQAHDWLRSMPPPGRHLRVYQELNRSGHHPTSRDLKTLVRDTESLVGALRSRLP